MKDYIFFKEIKVFPPWSEAVKFVYDESFVGIDYASMYRFNDDNSINEFHTNWPKWQDNANLPLYVALEVVFIHFQKTSEKVEDDWYSKQSIKIAQRHNYQYIGLAAIGGAQGPTHNPALIDVETFHKMIYFFSLHLDGEIWNTRERKFRTAEEYYAKYKKFIDAKFCRKLTPEKIARYGKEWWYDEEECKQKSK